MNGNSGIRLIASCSCSSTLTSSIPSIRSSNSELMRSTCRPFNARFKPSMPLLWRAKGARLNRGYHSARICRNAVRVIECPHPRSLLSHFNSLARYAHSTAMVLRSVRVYTRTSQGDSSDLPKQRLSGRPTFEADMRSDQPMFAHRT